MVWDLYDGVRAGVADLNGAPHYFASQFDVRADNYSEDFKLCPIESEFVQRAIRYWEIYRACEREFHNGKADLKTHPGHGGIDAQYDELKRWLNEQVTHLKALPLPYTARFRELPGQDDLPRGMLRELEVAWSHLGA